MSIGNKLFVEKYRPQTLEDYIWQNEAQKLQFKKYVDEGVIPNMLLTGSPGGGKTSLAKVLINELGIEPIDLMFINASDENSVDTVREKISDFVFSYASGQFKLVVLDEFDMFSIQGQGILRNLIEESVSNARFILTCNYENRVIPAIKSRLQTFHMKAPDFESVLVKAVTILMDEQIEFEPDVLEAVVRAAYPDIRSVIKLLQQYSSSGTLQPVTGGGNADWKLDLIDLIEAGNWAECRKVVCNSAAPEEIEGVYTFLYRNMDKCKKFAEDLALYNAAILILAKYLNMHAVSADTELTLSACFIELGRL